MKKVLSLTLALVLLLGLCACGGSSGASGSSGGAPNRAPTSDQAGPEGYYIRKKDSVPMGQASNTIDPAAIYSALTYTPQMFYGDYRLLGGDMADEAFGGKAETFTATLKGDQVTLSVLPTRIEAGTHSLQHRVNDIAGYNWMRLYLRRKLDDGTNALYTTFAAYTVQDNTLELTLLDTMEVDDEAKKINYTMSDTKLTYRFSFSGRELTLKTPNGGSVTLTTGLDVTEDSAYFYTDHYLVPGSPAAAGMDNIRLRYRFGDDSQAYVEGVSGERVYEPAYFLGEDGTFTATVPWEEGTRTDSFLYFYCGDDGLILTDGKEVSYYNHTNHDRHFSTVSGFVSEDQAAALEELSESQLEAIVEKKENLFADLAAAFTQEGLNVTVNEASGEIALDSAVLFEVGESAIGDAGKDFLQKFVMVYSSVVYSEKYDNFVSKVMVEGHTDTSGDYELNKTLSQDRADSVRNYCLSMVGDEKLARLVADLEAVGYAYDKPIYAADGSVDMDASRRVSFRFIINLEQAA